MLVVTIEVREIGPQGSHLLATATDVPESLADLPNTLDRLTAVLLPLHPKE